MRPACRNAWCSRPASANIIIPCLPTAPQLFPALKQRVQRFWRNREAQDGDDREAEEAGGWGGVFQYV